MALSRQDSFDRIMDGDEETLFFDIDIPPSPTGSANKPSAFRARGQDLSLGNFQDPRSMGPRRRPWRNDFSLGDEDAMSPPRPSSSEESPSSSSSASPTSATPTTGSPTTAGPKVNPGSDEQPQLFVPTVISFIPDSPESKREEVKRKKRSSTKKRRRDDKPRYPLDGTTPSEQFVASMVCCADFTLDVFEGACGVEEEMETINEDVAWCVSFL